MKTEILSIILSLCHNLGTGSNFDRCILFFAEYDPKTLPGVRCVNNAFREFLKSEENRVHLCSNYTFSEERKNERCKYPSEEVVRKSILGDLSKCLKNTKGGSK